VIQPEIEAADQGQTLIAIAWAIDSSNQLIASCAPVFGRRSTVSPGRERVVRMRIGNRGSALARRQLDTPPPQVDRAVSAHRRQQAKAMVSASRA